MGLDLARTAPRGFSPADLASRMWNHAPTMWAAIESAGIPHPKLSDQDAADLFAFFYSERFFDPPGDVERGQRAFQAKQCGLCHGITESKAEGAPPVSKWQSLADPIVMVQQMWNHSFRMHQAFERRGLEWQSLTTSQLADVLAYLSSLPETQHFAERFSNTSGEGGARIFRAKGCVKCHVGNLSLDRRLKDMTLTDIAVNMWNHAPRMVRPAPTLTLQEMRQLLSYLWMGQFVNPGGDIAAGKQVFATRRCALCHYRGAHGALQLPGQARSYSEITIISALWRHGPLMHNRMKRAGIAWPQFRNAKEMADLVAFLNSVQ